MIDYFSINLLYFLMMESLLNDVTLLYLNIFLINK